MVSDIYPTFDVPNVYNLRNCSKTLGLKTSVGNKIAVGILNEQSILKEDIYYLIYFKRKLLILLLKLGNEILEYLTIIILNSYFYSSFVLYNSIWSEALISIR